MQFFPYKSKQIYDEVGGRKDQVVCIHYISETMASRTANIFANLLKNLTFIVDSTEDLIFLLIYKPNYFLLKHLFSYIACI